MFNFKKRWHSYYEKKIGKEDYFFLSSSYYIFYRDLFPLIRQYAKGRCLDLGAGKMAYRFILKPLVQEYISVDKYQCHSELDYQSDILKLPFEDNSFDTVFCSQVFEHIPQPWLAIQEINRILKKDGVLILTAPHLSYLHEIPNDFYRYTKYGFEQLAKEGNLEAIKIIPSGGLLSFLFAPFSIILLVVFSSFPILRDIIFCLNKYLSILIVWLDAKLDRQGLFALNYIGIFRKQ